jgi:hypothetical protein
MSLDDEDEETLDEFVDELELDNDPLRPISYLHAALVFAHMGEEKDMDFMLSSYFHSRGMPECKPLIKKMYDILQKNLPEDELFQNFYH